MATKYNTGKENKSNFKKIEETEGSGFGEYVEDTGGGKPFSTSNTRTTKENGKYRKANNDTLQPRTKSGQFTYKSVNGQSIDPKYGPSRGKTVNPLLTGGVNGIKIEDVEKQFSEKKGSYWDKYKDKWYVKGSKAVAGNGDYRTHVSGESIWEIARQRYDAVKKEFGGKIEWDDISKKWVATDKGSESENWSEIKKGKKSSSEKAAAQEAYLNNAAAFVKDIDDSIEKIDKPVEEKKKYNPHWGTNLEEGKGKGHSWKPKMATPTMTTAEYEASKKVSEPSEPVNKPAPIAAEAPVSKPAEPVSKYTNENYDMVVSYFSKKFENDPKKDMLIEKFNGLSPKDKEKQVDIWKSKGVDFGF